MKRVDQQITCLVLEDHAAAMNMLKTVLKERFSNIQAFYSTSIEEANKLFEKVQPVLLILDINLPDGNVFDWLKKRFQQQLGDLVIIFTTAYAQFAVEAFRFSALHFLLKPYLPEELTGAIHRAIDLIGDRQYRLQMETLFYNRQTPFGQEKKIVLKTIEEIHVVKMSDILALEADNSYTRFYLFRGEEILVSYPLKSFDRQMAAYGFLRIHQSFLINTAFIQRYKKKQNRVLLEGGKEFPVSLNKKADLLLYLSTL